MTPLKITNISYDELLSLFYKAINNNIKIKIAYANTHTIMTFYRKSNLTLLNSFNLLHLDGFGVYLICKLLYPKLRLHRITGSDFYSILLEKSIENNWKIFLFGDTEETLAQIKKQNFNNVFVGFQNGYFYDLNELIVTINNCKPDIVMVGLGAPKQEELIINIFNEIDSKIILAVGDGIKIFSKTKKRGPKFIQRIGLEWFIRLINEPRRLWKRYLVDIPLFIFLVLQRKIRLKIVNENKNH